MTNNCPASALQPRLEALLRNIRHRPNLTALVHRNATLSFAELDQKLANWLADLKASKIEPGQVVALKADYSPECVSLLLALLSNRNIVALLPPSAKDDGAYLADSHANWFRSFEPGTAPRWNHVPGKETHPRLDELRQRFRWK